MKFFILACVIACVASQKYDLKFFEKTNYFDEKVKVDNQKNTVEFDVPKHGKVQEAKYLNDYQKRLIVMKLHSSKSCYAWDMPIDESSPAQIQAGLKHFQGKFPEDRFMVINENMLPLHYLNTSSLTDEIKDFCGSYPVMKVALFKDQAAMESAALQAAKAKISGGRTKRGTVTDFFLCDNNTGKFVGECGRSGAQLKIKCKFVVAQTCVFKVACDFSAKGWQCPVPGHMFHYLHCCDYSC